MTRFHIFAQPDGWGDTLCRADAKTGSGTPMADFIRDFDGSELAFEFEVPPVVPEDYDPEYTPMELTPMQTWVIAKLVNEAFNEGHQHGIGVSQCAVHNGEVHGGEAAELRGGIESIISDQSIDDVEELYRRLQDLLDSVDARDSLADAELAGQDRSAMDRLKLRLGLKKGRR